ncbi:hypothetical protein BDK51DRAFT_24267, partial [Blyttiomyces helicus]
LLDKANVPKGEWLVQNASGSALAKMLIGVAKSKGIKTINIVRRTAQIPEIGGDVVLSSENKTPQELADAIQAAIGGARPYAALDAVGGSASHALSLAVRDHGTVITYGVLDGGLVTLSGLAALMRGIIHTGYAVNQDARNLTVEGRHAFCTEALDLMAKGHMVADAGLKYSLEQVIEAVAKSGEAAKGGKVLLYN